MSGFVRRGEAFVGFEMPEDGMTPTQEAVAWAFDLDLKHHYHGDNEIIYRQEGFVDRVDIPYAHGHIVAKRVHNTYYDWEYEQRWEYNMRLRENVKTVLTIDLIWKELMEDTNAY